MLETDQSRGTAQRGEVRDVLVAPRGNLRLVGGKNRGNGFGGRFGGKGGRVYRGEFGVGSIERSGRRNYRVNRGDRRDGWIGGNRGNRGNRRRLGIGIGMRIGGQEGVEVIDEIGMAVEELANLGMRGKKRENPLFHIGYAEVTVGLTPKNGNEFFILFIAAIFKTLLNSIDILLDMSRSHACFSNIRNVVRICSKGIRIIHFGTVLVR